MEDNQNINIFQNDRKVIHNDQVVETVYINPLFPNNFLMNIYQGILRYISKNVPRKVNYNVVTTYQRGIQALQEKFTDNVNQYKPRGSILVLQPGQLKIDERVNNTWNTMSSESEWIARSSLPPYASIGDLKMWVVTNRFTFNFELFYIAASYLELMDMYFHINRLFNTRYKYLKNIAQSNIMLGQYVTDKIKELYGGKNLFELSDDFKLSFISAYNRTFYAIPWTSNIHLKMGDYSDGSNYLGDSELPTFKISFSCEAFFQIPVNLILGFQTEPDALVLTLSDNNQNESIDVNTFLRYNDKEAYIVHIYDDYPENIVITLTRSQLNPDLFKDYYVKLTHIDSGVESIVNRDDDKFIVNFDETTTTFKINNVEKGYVIDIIGIKNNS